MQFGNTQFSLPLCGPDEAAKDEALGFDLRYFGENSLYASDPFLELRDAARVTSRIRLAVGATNFLTRHPAVIANQISSVQMASHGRAICGIATGDSAVGVLGLRPQKLAEFQADAIKLREYLQPPREDDGPFDHITWLPKEGYSPAPIEMMCSGPRAIGVAAAVADRITLTVGAAPERLKWAVDRVAEGLEQADRRREDVELGAFIAMAVDDDPAAATERLCIRCNPLAHMAALPGVNLDRQPEKLREVTQRLRAEYHYKHHHVRNDNPLGALIEPEFAHWFGIGGNPAHVVDRLGEVAELGIDYVFLAGVRGDERAQFASEVMPHLRDTAPEPVPPAS